MPREISHSLERRWWIADVFGVSIESIWVNFVKDKLGYDAAWKVKINISGEIMQSCGFIAESELH